MDTRRTCPVARTVSLVRRGQLVPMVLLPLVKTFLAARPDVKIDLRLNDGFIDLLEEGFDVAGRSGALADRTAVGTARRHHPTRVDRQPQPSALTAQAPDTPRLPDDLLQHNRTFHSELARQNTWSFIARPGAPVPPLPVHLVSTLRRQKSDKVLALAQHVAAR